MTMQAKIQEERDEAHAEGLTEGLAKGLTEGVTKGRVEALYSLVIENVITLSEAAKRADMTEEQFLGIAKKRT